MVAIKKGNVIQLEPRIMLWKRPGPGRKQEEQNFEIQEKINCLFPGISLGQESIRLLSKQRVNVEEAVCVSNAKDLPEEEGWVYRLLAYVKTQGFYDESNGELTVIYD